MEPGTDESTLDSPEETAAVKNASTTKPKTFLENGKSEETAENSMEETELEKGNDSEITKDSTTKQEIENGTLPEMPVEEQTKREDLITNTSVNDESVSLVNNTVISDASVKDEAGMIIKEVPPSDYPEFAVIHSFLTMFGVELDLPNVSLVDLNFVFSMNYQLSIDKGIYILYRHYLTFIYF